MSKSKFVGIKVHDPATNNVLGSLPDCNTDDVNLAVEAANSAFQVWSNFTAEVI